MALNLSPKSFCFAGRKEVADVRHDFDLLIHYMDHEYKFNIHKAITEGHNQKLQVWTYKLELCVKKAITQERTKTTWSLNLNLKTLLDIS